MKVLGSHGIRIPLLKGGWPMTPKIPDTDRGSSPRDLDRTHGPSKDVGRTPRDVWWFFGMWMFPKIGVSPKWMVKIMENPSNPWMIWRENPLFSETPMSCRDTGGLFFVYFLCKFLFAFTKMLLKICLYNFLKLYIMVSCRIVIVI